MIFEIFGYFGFFWIFFGFFKKLLMLLLKVTKVTTGHQKWPKIGQNSTIRPFFTQRTHKSISFRTSPSHPIFFLLSSTPLPCLIYGAYYKTSFLFLEPFSTTIYTTYMLPPVYMNSTTFCSTSGSMSSTTTSPPSASLILELSILSNTSDLKKEACCP